MKDNTSTRGHRPAAQPAGWDDSEGRYGRTAAAGSSPRYNRLTARELEVLTLLAEGLPNKMIGRRLGISAATVKCHIGKVLAALGVASRLEAVIVAARLGLVGDALTGADERPAGKNGVAHDAPGRRAGPRAAR